MKVEFKRLDNALDLAVPAYATPGAAGMDIRSAEYKEIAPRQTVTLSTGFAVAVPEGYEMQVRPRSGLAAKNAITIVNAPGTVDSDYRGEIKIILHNLGNDVFTCNFGDRIAQLVIAPVTQAEVVEVEELDETERGADGFGSTGRN